MSDQRGLTELGGEPDDDPAVHRPMGRVIALVGVAVAVVVILIIVVVRSMGGDGEPDGATGPTPGSSATTGAGSSSPAVTGNESTSSAPTAGSEEPSATRSASPPTESAKPGETRSPVPIKTPAEVKAGLTASITGVAAVKGQADGPGEVAGPAVRFTLTLRNSSTDDVPLNTTVVNVYYGKAGTPASPLLEPGGVPLPDAVAAGGEASGTYVFVVPRKARNRVLITVDYSVDVSLVAFRGAVPR